MARLSWCLAAVVSWGKFFFSCFFPLRATRRDQVGAVSKPSPTRVRTGSPCVSAAVRQSPPLSHKLPQLADFPPRLLPVLMSFAGVC